MKTGLYFGSFNPVHIGHMAVANYMLEFSDLNEIWFVVSPHNPLKEHSGLLPEYHRLELVNRAIGDQPGYKSSNIEFKMPKPSFTIDTLIYLEDKYPKNKFVLVMGTDNFPSFHKWKNYEILLENYEFYVYPRPGYEMDNYLKYNNIKQFDAPLMNISASFVRDCIKAGKDMRYFVPETVYQYIKEMNFYKK